MVWRTKKCNIKFKVTHFFVFFALFHYPFYPCYSFFVKMENMLWIEDIVESTSTPPFFLSILELTWLVL
jgi:uncharacterized membrane protein